MFALWVGITIVYAILLACRKPRQHSLFHLFLCAYLVRSLVRMTIYVYFPDWYAVTYWPLYWALAMLAVAAAYQSFQRDELHILVGFAVYYGMDAGTRPIPTINTGVQVVKMLPALLAALFWLYGELKHDRAWIGDKRNERMGTGLYGWGVHGRISDHFDACLEMVCVATTGRLHEAPGKVRKFNLGSRHSYRARGGETKVLPLPHA